jgi:hypothetical protein
MRDAALIYLGINPSKPAVEFEIRLLKDALSAIADTQVEGKFSTAERCGAGVLASPAKENSRRRPNLSL